MTRPLPLLLLALLPACAPVMTTAPTPPAQYQASGPAVITAIVQAAPTLKPLPLRQPWRAEEASNNRVVLRAYSALGGLGGAAGLPLEVLFTTVTSGNVTTVTPSSAPVTQATVAEVFQKLDQTFKRVK